MYVHPGRRPMLWYDISLGPVPDRWHGMIYPWARVPQSLPVPLGWWGVSGSAGTGWGGSGPSQISVDTYSDTYSRHKHVSCYCKTLHIFSYTKHVLTRLDTYWHVLTRIHLKTNLKTKHCFLDKTQFFSVPKSCTMTRIRILICLQGGSGIPGSGRADMPGRVWLSRGRLASGGGRVWTPPEHYKSHSANRQIKICPSFKYQVSSFKCQVSSIKHQLSIINYQASSLECKVPIAKYQAPSINYQASSFKYQVSSIKCQVSSTKYQVSNIKYQVPSIKHQVRSVKHQVPSAKYQGSNVNYQVASIKYQVSSIKNQVSSAKHQAPIAKYQVPSTKYQVKSVKHQVSSTKYQASSIKHQVSWMRWARWGRQCGTERPWQRMMKNRDRKWRSVAIENDEKS